MHSKHNDHLLSSVCRTRATSLNVFEITRTQLATLAEQLLSGSPPDNHIYHRLHRNSQVFGNSGQREFLLEGDREVVRLPLWTRSSTATRTIQQGVEPPQPCDPWIESVLYIYLLAADVLTRAGLYVGCSA